MKAYLMHSDDHPGHGVTEWWETEDGKAICVDYNVHISETMRRDRMKSWNEIGVWHGDMTGGKAMRELGYEPVEEAEHVEGQDQARKDQGA